MVTANGLEFGVLEEGSGPLALCMHGFPDSAHSWRHLLPALAGSGFHAVAPFMRGYAPTAIPADENYSIGALVADATALHEALDGDERAVLIGHDWGAAASYGAAAFAPRALAPAGRACHPPRLIDLAALLRLRPDQAVLLLLPLLDPAGRARRLRRRDGVHRSAVGGLVARLRPQGRSSGGQGVPPRSRQPQRGDRLLPRHRRRAHRLRRADLVGRAGGLGGRTPQPTLYLQGDVDGCVGLETVEDVETHLASGSKLEVVEGPATSSTWRSPPR